MNKLFGKTAVLVVGTFMAVGLASCASSSSMSARVAKADDSLLCSLDGSVTEAGKSAYATKHEFERDGKTWVVQGNLTTTPWRVGGLKKSGASDPANTDTRVVGCKTAFEEGISKVTFEAGAIGITVNSAKLNVYSTVDLLNAGGAGDIDSVSSTADFDANKTNEFVLNKTDVDYSGRFFAFEFNLTNNTTSHKFIELQKVNFYINASGTVDSVTVKDSAGATGPLTIAGVEGYSTVQLHADVSHTGPVNEGVIWSSSDEQKATVDENGLVKLLKSEPAGVTITATSVADNTKSDTILIQSNLIAAENVETTEFTTAVYGSANITVVTQDVPDEEGEGTHKEEVSPFSTDALGSEITSGLTNSLIEVHYGTGSSNGGYYYNPASLRVYTGNTMKIAAKGNYRLAAVKLESLSASDNPVAPAKLSLDKGQVAVIDNDAYIVMGASDTELVITMNAQVRLKAVKIVLAENGDAPTPPTPGPDDPTPTPTPSGGGSKGCGGDIATVSVILSAISLAGVGLLLLKKRVKE